MLTRLDIPTILALPWRLWQAYYHASWSLRALLSGPTSGHVPIPHTVTTKHGYLDDPDAAGRTCEDQHNLENSQEPEPIMLGYLIILPQVWQPA